MNFVDSELNRYFVEAMTLSIKLDEASSLIVQNALRKRLIQVPEIDTTATRKAFEQFMALEIQDQNLALQVARLKDEMFQRVRDLEGAASLTKGKFKRKAKRF